jgi:RNA polymerase sigma factor (sigma-70 family)
VPTSSASLEELLAHRDWVRRVARALVLDEHLADDLEQETWLRSISPPAPRSPRAWLGTILRHTASNMRLAQRRRDAHERSAPQPAPIAPPDEIAERAEVVERVARAVRALREPYRTAIFLRYFEDIPADAIAERLRVPVDTVRTRVRRGLAILRARLDEEQDGDRRRWCVLLAPMAGEVPSVPRGGAAVLTNPLGVWLMTSTVRTALATVLLACLGGGALWLWGPSTSPAMETAALEGTKPSPSSPAPSAATRPRTRASAPVEDQIVPVAKPATAATGTTAQGRLLDEIAGTPVAEARVALTGSWSAYPLERERCKGKTDADGRFEISGIDKGAESSEYLRVEADGYADALLSISGWALRRTPGQPADLGELRLERGAPVSGRVLATDGSPVAGARILFCWETVTSAPPTNQPDRSKEMGASDLEGRFALPRIAGARGGFRHTLFAIADSGVGWLSLAPYAGRKDLVAQDIRLAPTATVAVLVRGPQGPIAVAHVTAEPHFEPLGQKAEWTPSHQLVIGRADMKTIFTGATDAAGQLSLPRLPIDGDSCKYDIVAVADGYARGWKDGITLRAGDEVQAVVELKPVRKVLVTGTIRSADGVGLGSAEVVFDMWKARTDAQGVYRVEDVDPDRLIGSRMISVDAPGFAKAQRTIRYRGSGDIEGIDFVLDRAVLVHGKVVEESGAPVQGAWVTLQTSAAWEDRVDSMPTGADGNFEMRAGAGRETTLSAQPPRGREDVYAPEPIKVPKDGGEIVVTLRKLPPSTAVLVEVLDDATGLPLDPTRGDLRPLSGTRVPNVSWPSPRLDAGRVVFTRTYPGDWCVWVGTVGHAPAYARVHVDESQKEVKATVRCVLPGVLRGVVAGLPAGNWRRLVFLSLVGLESKPDWVRVSPDSKSSWDEVPVDDAGAFRVERALPGRIRLWTELDGFRGETEVELAPSGVADVVLTVKPIGRVRFRSAGPPPLPVLVVRHATADGPWSNWMGISGSDGKLPEWTTNVMPGRVRWQARYGGFGRDRDIDEAPTSSGEFEANAGETFEVSVPVR